VKNVSKGDNVIKENKEQTYAFIDEFFEESIKVLVLMKQMKMLIMNIGHQTIMLMQHLA
jgi:hypothetical protein